MIIESQRLLIKSLTIDELVSFKTNKTLIEDEYILDDLEINDILKRAMEIKINKMKQVDVSLHDWFTYWMMIEKISLKVIGLIGFKGLEEDGYAEVGYGISRQFEGKGYTTEALNCLLNWAFKDRRCKEIIATGVLKTNIGSQKVLEKNGFQRIKEDESSINFVKKKHG